MMPFSNLKPVGFFFLGLFSLMSIPHCVVVGQEGELRKGASGSGEIITNETKTIARRRTRPAKPRATPPTEAPKTAADYFGQGDQLFEKGEYAAAAKAFEAATRLDPKFQEAYYALGDAYLKLKEDDKALEADRLGREVAQRKRTLISGGIMNGKALSLPIPTTPAIAKAVRASGEVVVQVLVDENGEVMSAKAVSGHALLQQAAVKAAMEARFSPLKMSGVPMKVIGVLNYQFN